VLVHSGFCFCTVLSCVSRASTFYMARPTFIIAEPEPEQALSARKLVIETAKFNVITAHSRQELREFLDRYPNVEAVIVHTRLEPGRQGAVCEEVRERVPDKKIIAISPRRGEAQSADYELDSHDPEQLVDLLRELFGDPRKVAA